MPNDWDLLRTFAREKDQRGGDAFSELVTRHVDMVYGVARRMLGTAQADDAVQAVFLLLSQRADRISANGSLAGWLFRTTMYCCGNIKKSEDRRRRHERSSTMKQNEHVATNEELTAVLDEALERLGEKQRQAILVRYLENKSVAQTSEALGVSVSVVERRLRHGLEKIREVFARHGFVVPTVAVGAVMMAESAKAAPAGLVASAVGVTTQASASVVGIAKGALTMMKLAAVKTIAAVVAVVVFIVIAAASVSLLPKDQGVPEVVTEVKGKAVEEKQAMNHGFTRHKLFEYRFDVVEFPESLKVAGVPKYHGGHDDFVGEYYRKFKPLMKNRYEPYTEICVWSSLLGEQRANSWESGDRIFGCLVMSLDDLPEGIVGADIRVKKFLVMTVRGDSWEKCGAVGYPTDLFKELMPKEYKDALYPPIQEVNWHFQIGRDDVFFMSYIESEREIKTNPDAVICERKYYAPLLATTEKANKVPGIRDYMVGMKGHNYRLPDCLSFIWERLGDHPDLPLDFWDFAAITGDTVAPVYFRDPDPKKTLEALEFHRDPNIRIFGEDCVSEYLAGREYIGQIFDAIGYDHSYVAAAEAKADRAAFIKRVVDEIDRGRPVLSLAQMVPGTTGGSWSLVLGYEQGGGVLRLWSHGTSTAPSPPTVPYDITGDFDGDFVFIGPRKKEVTREDLYLVAIRRMAHWLTLPERDGYFFGAAALRAWAEDIEKGRYEEEFADWHHYKTFVCNMATNGGGLSAQFWTLSKMNAKYANYAKTGEAIGRLLPSEHPNGGGRTLDWIRLEELGGGLYSMTPEMLRDKAQRTAIAAVLRDRAGRLDEVMKILNNLPKETVEGNR